MTPIRTAILLTALAVFFPGAATASWRGAADSLYAAAELCFEEGDYREAAELYGATMSRIRANDGVPEGRYFAGMAARSRFLMGSAYEQAEEWDEAIGAYSQCLAELEPIADVVRFRLARCRREAGQLDEAVVLLRQVVDDDSRTIVDLAAIEGLADWYREAGHHDMALQWYRVLLADAETYDDRARAHYKIGLAYEERGDEEAARASYATAVDEFPRSRHAHDALDRGRRISRAFTDRYHQGLVLYNRNRFKDASEFFSYYLRHDSDKEFEHEATYFLGRSHQRRGNFRTAARKYEATIELGGEGEYFDLAWLKLSYCLRATGRLSESLEMYDRFVSLYPDREGAPTAVWEKARLLEEEGRWREAEREYCGLRERYPTAELADAALFRAGLCLFKLEQYADADAVFADLFAHCDGADAARALFWAGKSREALREVDEARERYREAVESARDSFYGRRSLDKLRGGASAKAAEPQTEGRAVPRAGAAGRAEGSSGAESLRFASWLAEWHDEVYLPADRFELRRRLMEDPLFVRAHLFLGLHLKSEAEDELDLLEAGLWDDPRVLDILCAYYERAGLSRRAIRAAERILSLSPGKGVSDAPVYLRKKICPRRFHSLVEGECRDRELDPNLFYSLIRQESLFEPEAVSWVGARGLTQIMPTTGAWIARRLRHHGFRVSHLFEPEANVRFGAYYLSVQLEDFDGDIMRALAAYNGGPDNVKRWWDYGGAGDVDVFVEDIGFSQTSDYVRRVYLYYRFYEDAYGASPG